MRKTRTIVTEAGFGNGSPCRLQMLSRQRTRTRRGQAAVEFAVVAPVITLIFLSSINAMHNISVKHNLQLVAYMAAAEVSSPESVLADVESHFELFGREAGLENIVLTITPYQGKIYTVTATAPAAGNNPLMPTSSGSLSAESYVYRSD